LTDTSERLVHLAYQLDSNDVLKDLGTSEQGLSSAEAQLRLAQHGPNLLAEEAPVSQRQSYC
jgi:magnesium-transporting ATPase (P-type)